MEELLALCNIKITNINYQNSKYYGYNLVHKSEPCILPEYKAIRVELKPKELTYDNFNHILNLIKNLDDPAIELKYQAPYAKFNKKLKIEFQDEMNKLEEYNKLVKETNKYFDVIYVAIKRLHQVFDAEYIKSINWSVKHPDTKIKIDEMIDDLTNGEFKIGGCGEDRNPIASDYYFELLEPKNEWFDFEKIVKCDSTYIFIHCHERTSMYQFIIDRNHLTQ